MFDSDNEEEPSTSAQRLDPALFQQAEAALQQAKDRAIQEQKQQRLLQANEQEGRIQTDLKKRSRKRGQPDGKATKVIGYVGVAVTRHSICAEGCFNLSSAT